MIKIDYSTYINKFIDMTQYDAYLLQKDAYIKQLKSCDMIGWIDDIDINVISKIKEVSTHIKNNFDCLVVVGIGGSFLGSYAFSKIFENKYTKSNFEVIYAGTTLSSKSLEELIAYLQNKKFCLNVISKSGSTMETTICYNLLKDVLKRKYSEDEVKKHIVVTTDKEKGALKEEANKNGYATFEIADDIGGRYSFLTPAHLLPLSLNFDIDKIIEGYYDGRRNIDKAYNYAVIRKLLFDSGKYIENYCVPDESMQDFTEWLKQLFGETEGKNLRGIYSTASVYTRDLHSLGQFIQEGNKIVFETFIKNNISKYYINYNGNNLHDINNRILSAVELAHYKGNVPIIEIEIDKIEEYSISELIYFFMLSAAFSGLLFEVDPFNQPGVEVYKSEVKEMLKDVAL